MLDKAARKLNSAAIRSVQFFRVQAFRCLSDNRIAGDFRRYQPVQATGRGRIEVSDTVKFGVRSSPLFLSTYAYLESRKSTAAIRIGARTWISNNFCAIADSSSIDVGADCVIGYNVELLDSDFHGIDPNARSSFTSSPISVGDRVFIGSNVKILKGVTIGDGSTIASGSVVTKNVSSNVVAGGNPARVLRELG